MLTHAEIIVRASRRDLGADAVFVGARKAAAAPVEIREHAVASLAPQLAELPVEKTLVIHTHPRTFRPTQRLLSSGFAARLLRRSSAGMTAVSGCHFEGSEARKSAWK